MFSSSFRGRRGLGHVFGVQRRSGRAQETLGRLCRALSLAGCAQTVSALSAASALVRTSAHAFSASIAASAVSALKEPPSAIANDALCQQHARLHGSFLSLYDALARAAASPLRTELTVRALEDGCAYGCSPDAISGEQLVAAAEAEGPAAAFRVFNAIAMGGATRPPVGAHAALLRACLRHRTAGPALPVLYALSAAASPPTDTELMSLCEIVDSGNERDVAEELVVEFALGTARVEAAASLAAASQHMGSEETEERKRGGEDADDEYSAGDSSISDGGSSDGGASSDDGSSNSDNTESGDFTSDNEGEAAELRALGFEKLTPDVWMQRVEVDLPSEQDGGDGELVVVDEEVGGVEGSAAAVAEATWWRSAAASVLTHARKRNTELTPAQFTLLMQRIRALRIKSEESLTPSYGDASAPLSPPPFADIAALSEAVETLVPSGEGLRKAAEWEDSARAFANALATDAAGLTERVVTAAARILDGDGSAASNTDPRVAAAATCARMYPGLREALLAGVRMRVLGGCLHALPGPGSDLDAVLASPQFLGRASGEARQEPPHVSQVSGMGEWPPHVSLFIRSQLVAGLTAAASGR